MLVHPENLLHNHRLLRHDLVFSVLVLCVPIQLAPAGNAFFKAFANAPDRVFGNGPALFLRKGSEDGQEHLRKSRPGVDVVALEDDVDADIVQTPHIGEAFERVAGKPADGLGQHQVDPSLLAILDHPLELWPLVRACPRNPVIRVNSGVFPFRICPDQLRIVLDLPLKAGFLLIRFRRNSGIATDAELVSGLCRRFLRSIQFDSLNVHLALLSAPALCPVAFSLYSPASAVQPRHA